MQEISKTTKGVFRKEPNVRDVTALKVLLEEAAGNNVNRCSEYNEILNEHGKQFAACTVFKQFIRNIQNNQRSKPIINKREFQKLLEIGEIIFEIKNHKGEYRQC